MPLAFEFDAHGFWVGGVGDAVARTRKFRNVAAGNDRVALVFDDLISLDPFAARCLRDYGRAGGHRPGVRGQVVSSSEGSVIDV